MAAMRIHQKRITDIRKMMTILAYVTFALLSVGFTLRSIEVRRLRRRVRELEASNGWKESVIKGMIKKKDEWPEEIWER